MACWPRLGFTLRPWAPQHPAAQCRVTHRCCVASGGSRAQQHTTEGAHTDCWTLDGNIYSLSMLLLLLLSLPSVPLIPLKSCTTTFPPRQEPACVGEKNNQHGRRRRPTWREKRRDCGNETRKHTHTRRRQVLHGARAQRREKKVSDPWVQTQARLLRIHATSRTLQTCFFFFPLQEPHVSLWLTCCRLILFCWCINCNVMFMYSLPDWGWLAGLQFRPLQLPGSLLRRSRLRLHPSWRHYGQVQHRAEGRRGYVLTDLITSTQKQFVNVQLQPRAFYRPCSFESFISISQDSHRTHVFFCHGQYKGVWQGWIWLMTINTSFFLQNHMIENRLYRI